MSSIDLFTFGETMLRLSAPNYQRLEQANQLEVQVGGAESTVAVNLARLGHQTMWFSVLPNNPLGYVIRNKIRSYGVDVSTIQWVDEARLGLYFVEYGSFPRGIEVIYDRYGSAFSQLMPNELPLQKIENAQWLHITGITPALSESCREAVLLAVSHAAAHKVKISVDVNYRSKLWSKEVASPVLDNLCQFADVVFVAQRDAITLFNTGEDAHEAVIGLSQRWEAQVFMSKGKQGAVASEGSHVFEQPAFEVQVVDRLGAGDAFAAGVLHRLLEDDNIEMALASGVALSALKLTLVGDLALTDRKQLNQIVVKGSLETLKR